MHHVLAHHAKLLVGQLARFVEHLVRGHDLAHVVEQAAQGQLLEHAAIKPEVTTEVGEQYGHVH
ncbi:hypothetical protein D1872_347180 [compost metagenome]